ncbi:hypothetical protein PCANC_13661 [Puccinia coronata f. sp. avenae]|nr:hypothetical protein PCANC_13661 [Puccinia coronata f. sp. avenae]
MLLTIASSRRTTNQVMMMTLFIWSLLSSLVSTDGTQVALVPDNTTLSDNSTAVATTQNTTPATPKICDIEAPSPAVWKAHNISGFIASYPNSSTITISEFARQNGVINFVCGIGETCDAGQICGPIPGPVWHVLFAVQQWNQQLESMNKAIGFAASVVKATSSQLAIDLFPPDKAKSDKLFNVAHIMSLVLAAAAVVSAVVICWFPGPNVIATAFAAAAVVAVVEASVTLEAQKAFNAMKSDSFTRWAHYTEAITHWQEDIQNKILDTSKRFLTSGINDPAAMGALMLAGNTFTNAVDKDTNDIERAMEDVIKRRLIAGILLDRKAFVTVNSDSCDQKGPNGAFKPEDGWLSWCKDGK